MKQKNGSFGTAVSQFLAQHGIGMRAKLIAIFLVVKVVPLLLLTIFAWQQIITLGTLLRQIAVADSSAALNASAVENIERMTTDTANSVARFLYARDDDIRYLATVAPSAEAYRSFAESKQGRIVEQGVWQLAPDGLSWVRTDMPAPAAITGGVSNNSENNDMDGFHYRKPETFTYRTAPLYDEITFVDLAGNEVVKYVSPDSTKVSYPLDPAPKNIAARENTYVKAETYYEKLRELAPGEIYVSDVIGAYVGSNYIGMYVPEVLAKEGEKRGYEIPYTPETQAYSGQENPNGQRFEGIVRWATPVTDEAGTVTGYVTFALNHDHIMEFTDHLTPMIDRYTDLPSAYEGNYAFIWDYQCRSICHPRHHSIVGYDPQTGDPQVPWLETSIYNGWKAGGDEKWIEYVQGLPTFDNQSRNKKPAPELTRAGMVGLDGRYLNNAPQCTGWMDLTVDGGSGSFYILWSGIYKLTTAAAIPYYTGQYAPSEANGFSQRGFGIVTVGAGLEDFTGPAVETEARLSDAMDENMTDTFQRLAVAAALIIVIVVLIAVLLASNLTGRINHLIAGISRFRAGERQFRFRAPVKDEFGTLADSFDDMADSVVDSVKNALSITDMDHRIIYMNDAGLEFCKMTLPEITGTLYGDSSVYPPGGPYDPILAMEQEREADIYFDEGSGRYLRGVANQFQNKDGDNIGYIIETHDVTDMVLEQMKIEEQRILLDRIFSASPDLIWYMDADGRYMTVNPRFAAISGGTPESFVGKMAEELLPRELAGRFLAADMSAIDSGEPRYTEERVTFADGHEETLDAVRTPIYDVATGALIGLLGFARDVTARVRIDQELRDTQVELEKAVTAANIANEHKGEFLARMSHEIRTPMNAIIGLTNIVQKKLAAMQGDDVAELEGQMERIEASSQHLLGLLNDILDISKIEAGKIELVEEPVELRQLADTVASIIKPRCDDKNIRFVTEFDDFSPHAYLTDALRLRQVLINLLGNAVKFTPECGMVEFRMKRLEQEEGRTLVSFSVRDTGIGIAEENQETIFQAFEQGGGHVSRQHGGTGLGLAISRRIVEMLGGEIQLESTEGEGSCFHFEVWLSETALTVPKAKTIVDTRSRFTGKRLLLVDDVEINRIIVTSMLEDTGIHIDEAVDGVEALEAVKRSQEPYDIILMDVQMPQMNGYDASAAIRALGRADTGVVPIVALTANAFQEDVDRALSYGMNAHVAKPVELGSLMEVLNRFLSES